MFCAGTVIETNTSSPMRVAASFGTASGMWTNGASGGPFLPQVTTAAQQHARKAARLKSQTPGRQPQIPTVYALGPTRSAGRMWESGLGIRDFRSVTY